MLRMYLRNQISPHLSTAIEKLMPYADRSDGRARIDAVIDGKIVVLEGKDIFIDAKYFAKLDEKRVTIEGDGKYVKINGSRVTRKFKVSEVIAHLNELKQLLESKQDDDKEEQAKVTEIRNRLKLILQYEHAEQQPVGFTKDLCDIVFDLQITLARAYPVSGQDFITLDDLARGTDNLIAFSSGHLINKTDIHRYYGENVARNPVTNAMLSERDINSLRAQGINELGLPVMLDQNQLAMAAWARGERSASLKGRFTGMVVGIIINVLFAVLIKFKGFRVFSPLVRKSMINASYFTGYLSAVISLRRAGERSSALNKLIYAAYSTMILLALAALIFQPTLAYLVAHSYISSVMSDAATAVFTKIVLPFVLPCLIVIGVSLRPEGRDEAFKNLFGYLIYRTLGSVGGFIGEKIGYRFGRINEYFFGGNQPVLAQPQMPAMIAQQQDDHQPDAGPAQAPIPPASLSSSAQAYQGLNINLEEVSHVMESKSVVCGQFSPSAPSWEDEMPTLASLSPRSQMREERAAAVERRLGVA